MNKDRFLELLNLFLDNELSPELQDELFDAIGRNEQYHALYLDYCRINKACSSLGRDTHLAVPKRSLRQTIYALGGMAAAIALCGLAVQNLVPIFSDGIRPAGDLDFVSVDSDQSQEFFRVANVSSSSSVDANGFKSARVQFVGVGNGLSNRPGRFASLQEGQSLATSFESEVLVSGEELSQALLSKINDPLNSIGGEDPLKLAPVGFSFIDTSRSFQPSTFSFEEADESNAD